MRLGDGYAVSLQGSFKAELYRPEVGEPRLSLSIVADAIVALRKPKPCSPKKEAPASLAGRKDPFDDRIPCEGITYKSNFNGLRRPKPIFHVLSTRSEARRLSAPPPIVRRVHRSLRPAAIKLREFAGQPLRARDPLNPAFPQYIGYTSELIPQTSMVVPARLRRRRAAAGPNLRCQTTSAVCREARRGPPLATNTTRGCRHLTRDQPTTNSLLTGKFTGNFQESVHAKPSPFLAPPFT